LADQATMLHSTNGKIGGSVIADIRERRAMLENQSNPCYCKNYGTERSEKAVILPFFEIFLT